jgi:hypothetical protein
MEIDFKLDDKVDTQDGDYVIRTGKIFHAGSYPDKQFDISPEEMLDAVNDFNPVDIDYEHVSGPLDGKLGKLEAVTVGKDGWSLIGSARLPKWLDNALGDAPRKVSATWDRESKRLKKLALTTNPRVPDAILMAAFSANQVAKNTPLEPLVQNVMQKYFEENGVDFVHRTWGGVIVMQDIHDMAARSGAICSDPDKDSKDNQSNNYSKAEFVSESEAKAIQQIHDAAKRGGAKCDSYKCFNKENTKMLKEIKSWFSGLSDEQIEELEKAGTKTQAKSDESEKEEKKEVKNSDKSDKIVDEPVKTEKKEVASAKKEDVENKIDEPSDREKQLEAELAQLRDEKVKVDAEKFADDEIKSYRAFPSERDLTIALFVQASKDDKASEAKVSFKKDNKEVEGTRVEALKALYAARKPHNLTSEEIDDVTLNVLDVENGDKTDYQKQAQEQAKAYAERQNSRNKKDNDK